MLTMPPSDDKRGRPRPCAGLDSLARGLAHEIRNPLSAISLNLQMMQEDLEASGQPSPGLVIEVYPGPKRNGKSS